jgi:acetyl esterase/lipase
VQAAELKAHPLAGRGWRPRGVFDWALTALALLLVVVAAAMAFYMLDPIDYDGLGKLGWIGFLFPLQLLIAAVAAAALAGLAWERGALAASIGFALVACVTTALAVWPSVAVWREAGRFHVSLSIGEALEPDLASNGSHGERSVVYARGSDGARLELDVWRGDDAGTGALRPAIVRVHGGAWTRGSRSGHSDWDRWLNSLGYDVFDVEYELPPPARWQDEVGDIKCALGWVDAHAAAYHLDRRRISTMGYSAGGNLAMLAAYSVGDALLPPSCDVPTVAIRSVVNLYGPADLALLYRSSGSRDYIDGALRQYVGGSPAEYPDRSRALSPVSHVDARTPPTITLLGESDRIIPTDQAHVLDEALGRAGVPHATYLLPATDHGFDVNWNGFGTQIARALIRDFLERHG